MLALPRNQFSPNFRIAFVPIAFALFSVATATAGQETLRHAFEANCVQCHGQDGKVKGDLDLLQIGDPQNLLATPQTIQDLIDVLEFQDMPPEEEGPLPDDTRTAMIGALQSLMETAISARTSFPQTPMRRMNRFQYSNAVQDLFQLNVEVFTLPERMAREHGNYFRPATGAMPQTLKVGSRPLGKSQLIEKRLAGIGPFPQDLRAEHGYDNRGDHLSLSPLLMESFLTLSRSIVDSPDFNKKTCGIWDDFFAPPAKTANLESVIKSRLQTFLTNAFRSPIDTETLNRYTSNTLARIQSGESFTQSMKLTASAALASPRFLYVYDLGGPDSDMALASRLSQLLWGSVPDTILLERAANGELGDPDTLASEVDRMLKDERLKRFCDSFPAQWLQLDRIITSTPDPKAWPSFYFSKYRGSMHMMLEPLLLFETIVVENRSILELIDSDYSYRSEYLDAFYQEGVDPQRMPPTAIPFSRVALDDRKYGGVITTAAVMTMTSNATRSKPITRGAWVASVIFNDPPEPPPADVPPLPEDHDDIDIESLTLRERLEMHRSNPECTGCHSRIDPLGFALENYGPTGLWRDQYENGRTVDSQGSLFRKYPFESITEFKDAILAEKDRFTRAFASHLLSFALGRAIGIEDYPSLDHITGATRQDGYRMQTLIKEIVLSDSFRHRTTKPNPTLADATP